MLLTLAIRGFYTQQQMKNILTYCLHVKYKKKF